MCIDSGNVDAWSTPLSESLYRSLRPLQITITLTEGALFIFVVVPVWEIAGKAESFNLQP